jgi:hypothetical protein
MKKDWILGFSGLLLVLLAFSGLTVEIKKILIIIVGMLIAIISFRAVSGHKIEKSIANAGLDNAKKEESQM